MRKEDTFGEIRFMKAYESKKKIQLIEKGLEKINESIERLNRITFDDLNEIVKR